MTTSETVSPQGDSGAKNMSGLLTQTHSEGGRWTRSTLDYARQYTACGWPVFVLGRAKRPVANCAACRAAEPDHDRQACRCLTCHGFYAASTDPARVAAMLAAL